MTDATPRRSLVPGPTGLPSMAPAENQGIAARAQAMREAQSQVGRPLGGLPEMFAHRDGPVGNLAGAIAEVMANVGTINKGGFNSYHRYHYARMEDLLQAITPLMGKNGIAVFQTEVEIKAVESRLVVAYDFVVAHKSGETMGPQRQSGMTIARNSKGEYDDKAINKCHTQARKYFLLSLFQVPAGDFEETGDSDSGPYDANQRQEKAPVPGPKDVAPERSAQAQAAQQAAQTSKKAAEEGIPHKIILGPGAGADQWSAAFIRAIGKAQSQDEIKQWDAANDTALQQMSQHYPDVYDAISTAVIRRISDLEAPPPAQKAGLGNGSGMPDPKQDTQEAMNWVASQLAQLKSWEGAKAFWNKYVMPREADFDEVDWGMLMEEWKRTETRLAPPDETMGMELKP